jgi:hypothetical protein
MPIAAYLCYPQLDTPSEVPHNANLILYQPRPPWERTIDRLPGHKVRLNSLSGRKPLLIQSPGPNLVINTGLVNGFDSLASGVTYVLPHRLWGSLYSSAKRNDCSPLTRHGT